MVAIFRWHRDIPIAFHLWTSQVVQQPSGLQVPGAGLWHCMFVNVSVKDEDVLSREPLQFLVILHCLFHECPVQSSQSESQSRCRSGRLRTLSHKKRLLCQLWHLNPHCQRRHGVNGLDFFFWGGGAGVEHLMIWWFYVRSPGCIVVPWKHVRKQSATTKPDLNWFPGNPSPWKWRQVKDLSMLHWKSHWKASQLGCPKLGWQEPSDLKNADQFHFNSPVLLLMFQ